MNQVTMIGFYEREFYFLSNFSAFAVRANGKIWMTSEHLYQACKFAPDQKNNKGENIRELVRGCLSAFDAKKCAKNHLQYRTQDWDEIKITVMEGILRAKLFQHEYIRTKLLESGTRELVEDSPLDGFWGWGMTHMGANNLGKLWMKLRKELQDGTFSLRP